MITSILAPLAEWGTILLLGGIAAIVLVRLIGGDINLSGLLSVKGADGTLRVSIDRYVMFAAAAVTAIRCAATFAGGIPWVSRWDVGVLGAANVLYLARKAWASRLPR